MSSINSSMSAFNATFQGQWPPRAKFEGWPECFDLYMQTCDQMPQMMLKLNDATLFRQWMKDCFKLHVQYEVRGAITEYLQEDKSLIWGFYTCLAHLVQGYRIGTVPVRIEEKNRTTLQFPDVIWLPFTQICNYLGVDHQISTMNCFLFNCIYENDGLIPKDIRFFMNATSHIQFTENNVGLLFIRIENLFKPVMDMMVEYLQLSELASQSNENIEFIHKRRVNILVKIKQVLVIMSQTFSEYSSGHLIEKEYMSKNIQDVLSWGLNGKGGVSGMQVLSFTFFDVFLGIKGQCLMYAHIIKSMSTLPKVALKILQDIKINQAGMFNSNWCENKTAELIEAKNDIIRNLYLFRLSHAKTAGKFSYASSSTAGGSMKTFCKADDKIIIDTQIESELRKRARETKEAMM